jgi:phage-related tail protein
MRPEEKAALAHKAARRGVSSGEYLRLAVDNFENLSDRQETELAELAKELKSAVPKIKAALESSCKTLEALHRENEAFFRERGIR